MMHQILVIEDNPADTATIQYFLKEREFKHRLFTTDSLLEGLEIAQDQQVDLVLLDLSLVDSSGFNTLRNYLKTAAGIPVIVMTGQSNQTVGMQAVKAGAQDFLVKGEFDSKRLVNTIQFSLERFRTQASLRKTASQLSQNEQRIRDVQRLAKMAHWEMDLVNNGMEWSEDMYIIFGVGPNVFQPTLSDYLNYVHREDRRAVEAFFEEVIRTGHPQRVEHRIVIDNRIIKHLLVRGQVKFDTDTNKVMLIGSVQDVSDRHAQPEDAMGEDNIETSEEDVAGQLLPRVNHGIRTSLASLLQLQYLLRQTSLDKQQREYLDNIAQSIDDLNLTLANILHYTILLGYREEPRKDEIPTRSLLGPLRNVLSGRAARSGRKFLFQAGKLPTVIYGDQDMLSHLLQASSELMLLYGEPGQLCKLHIGWTTEAGKTLLVATLTYRGEPIFWDASTPLLPQHILQLIIETDNLARQRKLLAKVCLEVAEHLSASLSERTGKGGERIFSWNIPTHTAEPSGLRVTDVPRRQLNILLVEDHPIQQIAIKRVLTAWSDLVQVEVAGTGEKALELFQKKFGDLVLLDLQLPGMDGFAVLERIQTMSKVPAIALTAMPSAVEEQRCLDAGFDAYLSKPFEPEALYEVIRLHFPHTDSSSPT